MAGVITRIIAQIPQRQSGTGGNGATSAIGGMNEPRVTQLIEGKISIITEASDTLIASANTEQSVTNVLTPTKKKEIYLKYPGSIRVVFELKGSTSALAKGKIYVNGVASGAERLVSAANTYTEYTEDIQIPSNANIQLYIWCSGAGAYTTYCKNFKIKYTKTTYPTEDFVVNID